MLCELDLCGSLVMFCSSLDKAQHYIYPSWIFLGQYPMLAFSYVKAVVQNKNKYLYATFPFHNISIFLLVYCLMF